MDSLVAFAMGQAARASGAKSKVFDWNKAARIIRDRKVVEASAGLSSDWEYTGGSIFRNGKPVPKEDTYVYLASIWATPELEVDGETLDCWIDADTSPGWDAETYWPQSALDILEGKEP